MAGDDRTGWDKLAEQVGGNPWDWVAAGVGGLAGAVVTVTMGGADLGHSIPAGATAAVTVRKAGAAALRGKLLNRRVRRLMGLLKEVGPSVDTLRQRLERELDLFEKGITTPDDLEVQLAAALAEYRVASVPPPSLP